MMPRTRKPRTTCVLSPRAVCGRDDHDDGERDDGDDQEHEQKAREGVHIVRLAAHGVRHQAGSGSPWNSSKNRRVSRSNAREPRQLVGSAVEACCFARSTHR